MKHQEENTPPSEGYMHIPFDKNTPKVNEAKLNSYGFDITNENAIIYTTRKLQFTIIGFRVNGQYDSLIATIKVNLNPHINDAYSYIQKIDLFNTDRLSNFIRTAASELKIANQIELKTAIFSLRERLLEYKIDKQKQEQGFTSELRLTPQERKEALDILKSDNLMECIEALLQQVGIPTENQNALRLFFITLSRHFDRPLHVLLQGSSELSKMLLQNITQTIPPEHLHEQTSMSQNALHYTNDRSYWKSRVLYAHQLDKNAKGIHTLKEFIDSGKLKRQTTQSDYITKQLYSVNKEVEGAITLLGYVEDGSLYQKLLQECFFIQIEENKINREAMLQYQMKEFAGLNNDEEQQEARTTLQNIHRLIEPVKVIIPFAMELNIPQQVFQPLRSSYQLLTFIKAVALLHQHQLPKKNINGETCIEANHEHLEIAIELLKEIMIRKSDVLTPNTRNFLEKLKKHIHNEQEAFTPRDMMITMGMKPSNFYNKLNTLKKQGFIIKQGGNKKNGEKYSIAEWKNYNQLEQGMNVLDEQLKHIKEKFPIGIQEVSTQVSKKHNPSNSNR